MGSLLVVTGPPGAGTSSVARLLAAAMDGRVLVEGDAFWRFLATAAIEPWLPEAHERNDVTIRAAAAATGAFVAGGYATVYDGVVGPWFLPAFARVAGLRRVHYAVLLPPADVCVARVRSRTGHGFTSEPATRHMHEQFAGSAIDARFVFADVTDEPGDAAREIAAARDAGTIELALPDSSA